METWREMMMDMVSEGAWSMVGSTASEWIGTPPVTKDGHHWCWHRLSYVPIFLFRDAQPDGESGAKTRPFNVTFPSRTSLEVKPVDSLGRSTGFSMVLPRRDTPRKIIQLSNSMGCSNQVTRDLGVSPWRAGNPHKITHSWPLLTNIFPDVPHLSPYN